MRGASSIKRSICASCSLHEGWRYSSWVGSTSSTSESAGGAESSATIGSTASNAAAGTKCQALVPAGSSSAGNAAPV